MGVVSNRISCIESDELIEDLKLKSFYERWSGTGWHIVEWVDESSEIVLQSHTHYDRDFPTECVHYDMR